MPYFPERREQAYKCPGCGGTFYPSSFRCAVAHAPGTCCHYGETNALGAVIGPDGLPASPAKETTPETPQKDR